MTEAGINLLLPLPPLDGGVGGWERCTTPTPPFFKDNIIPPEEGVEERLADRLRMDEDGLTARVLCYSTTSLRRPRDLGM